MRFVCDVKAESRLYSVYCRNHGLHLRELDCSEIKHYFIIYLIFFCFFKYQCNNMKLKYPHGMLHFISEVKTEVSAFQGCSRVKKQEIAWKLFWHFWTNPNYFPAMSHLVPPPPTEESGRSEISQLWFLKSNPCSHQVNHGIRVPYQPWSWWANLALRGFSLLKAITADSVSVSWLPLRLDKPLKALYLFISLLRCCTPSP